MDIFYWAKCLNLFYTFYLDDFHLFYFLLTSFFIPLCLFYFMANFINIDYRELNNNFFNIQNIYYLNIFLLSVHFIDFIFILKAILIPYVYN